MIYFLLSRHHPRICKNISLLLHLRIRNSVITGLVPFFPPKRWFSNKKPAAFSGFLDYRGCLRMICWRRVGDSNPRRSLWPLNRFRVDPVTTTSVTLRMADGSKKRQRRRPKRPYLLFMAERAGFEPAVHLCGRTHDFQSCSFGLSDISPRLMHSSRRLLSSFP